MLEAVATARPIITTDAPGCRQTEVDGKSGFLIPPKNAEALAKKMIWFIENPKQAITMGKASHEICTQKFEVSKVNSDMMKIMGLIQI